MAVGLQCQRRNAARNWRKYTKVYLLLPEAASFIGLRFGRANPVGRDGDKIATSKQLQDVAMKRDPHELSEREKSQLQEELLIPTGEFVALFIGALLTLGLLAGPLTLAGATKNVLVASVATFSGAVAHVATMGSRMEARASDQSAVSAKSQ